MKLSNLIISILVVGLVITCCMTFLTSLSHEYSQNINLTGFNRTEQRLNSTHELVYQTQSELDAMNLSEPTNAIMMPYRMIKTAWNVMKMTFNSIFTVEAIIQDGATQASVLGVPIPDWVVPVAIAILVIIVVFIAVEAFLKWRLEH